jgi:hypothetical protein
MVRNGPLMYHPTFGRIDTVRPATTFALIWRRSKSKRIALGRLRTTAKIYEAIGRLKERYPRVARYYQLAYDEQQGQLTCLEDLQRKQKAESLDGSYLLKSSRNDLSAEDIRRTFILLTRVEAAFRAMKSPLCERP